MQTMQTMQSMGSMPDMRSQGMQGMSEPVWVEATVDEAMPEDRIVRLTHADIDAWGMPGTVAYTHPEPTRQAERSYAVFCLQKKTTPYSHDHLSH